LLYLQERLDILLKYGIVPRNEKLFQEGVMDDAKKCPDCQELLSLSLECYKSLRRKYPVRTQWTPEFEVWRTALENLTGKDLRGSLDWKIDQITPAWFINED
jgi:hypothetical protein